ncbi:hypothetical protein LINPERPRIM_LOCUS31640, partial [Linum perenne]
MNCWFRRDWRCSFAETECVFEQIFRFDLVDSLIDSGLIPRGPNALDTSLVTLFDGKNL